MLIAQITDMHIRPQGEKANGFIDTNSMLKDCIYDLNKLPEQPDVVLATGDLTDNGLPSEYDVLRDLLSELRAPAYLIPGNHDRREEMKLAFPGHDYLPASGEFLNYCIDAHPIKMIGLDTIVPGSGHGELCDVRLSWLGARLDERRGHPVIIFMHHPPFITGLTGMDRINCRNGDAMADMLADHPNVERVLAGHYHRPIQTRFGGTIGSVAPSPAHQVHLDLNPTSKRARLIMEPPAYHLHFWTGDDAPGSGALITHQKYIGDFGGPRDFGDNPDYPGKKG